MSWRVSRSIAKRPLIAQFPMQKARWKQSGAGGCQSFAFFRDFRCILFQQAFFPRREAPGCRVHDSQRADRLSIRGVNGSACIKAERMPHQKRVSLETMIPLQVLHHDHGIRRHDMPADG